MVKPPVNLYLECSTILPGQWVAAVASHQLPELSELSQREVFTVLMCHPVSCQGHSLSRSANLHYGIYWQSMERENGGHLPKPFIFPEWTVTMQASTKTGRKIFKQSVEAMESVNGIFNLATES